MTLIFGNFPHPVGMWGCVENSQTSIFLHRLVCGNPGLKKFLVWSIKNKKPTVLVFGCFLFFVLFFCMIWSYIVISSSPEHRKYHLNLKWGDSIFLFRPISCTHFATLHHIQLPRSMGPVDESKQLFTLDCYLRQVQTPEKNLTEFWQRFWLSCCKYWRTFFCYFSNNLTFFTGIGNNLTSPVLDRLKIDLQ